MFIYFLALFHQLSFLLCHTESILHTLHTSLHLLPSVFLSLLLQRRTVPTPCTPPRSCGTPPSWLGSTDPKRTSLRENVHTVQRRKGMSILFSPTPGWFLCSSPSSCWSDWWGTLWSFMSFPNTDRCGQPPTST